MKITFIHSPENYYDQNYGTLFVPLWAYYLASYLPDGWDPVIVDCRIEDPITFGPANVFAFSGINQDLSSINRTWKLLKDRYPEATFILGGPITWSFEQECKLDLIDHFDHIFILDGEETLPRFLDELSTGDQSSKVIRSERVSLELARKIRFDLLDPKAHYYYGAVLEVSRGCPFLCEFCDIRVLPGNNRTNTKDISLIIEEIDEYAKRGIEKFQLACDNFIGDIQWSDRCLDAMLDWKQRNNADVSFFTWLTINLYKLPDQLRKMRECGFNTLFIGIESVNANSLLETAKVQNLNVLEDAVETIHSYGFIIAPGFIFGFDSDTETVFEDTLEFMKKTGVIGGDPSFLMALAGTPLYKRMHDSGRLIERNGEEGIERRKIQTNIRYLQDKDFLVQGFLDFITHYADAKYQYQRLMNHIDLMVSRGDYVESGTSSGYASPWLYLRLQASKSFYRKMLFRRIRYMLTPSRTWFASMAFFQVWRQSRRHSTNFFSNYFYWLYAWTNLALKYEGLTERDFDLHSVGEHFDLSKLMPHRHAAELKDQEQRDGVKATTQSKFTDRALRHLVEDGAV